MEHVAGPTVVLLGMMGARKTTVGQTLARLSGWPYRDNDRLVLEANGRPAEEIDAVDGTDALHAAEARALRHALSLPGPMIAAAAAWVVLDPGSAALLRRAPAVVYLRAQPETLRARIGAGAGRREAATDVGWLRARFAERDATYRDLATVTVETDDRTPNAIAREVLAAIG